MTRLHFDLWARWLRWEKAGFWASALAVSLLAGSALEGQSGTLQIRPLAREGNASEFLSPQNQTAVLVDGGKAGPGNTAFDSGGVPVLKRLWDQGYRNLMILCSHPHADHAGKLREIVGYVAKSGDDIDLTRFTSVVLVDSEYKKGQSLFDVSRVVHGELASIKHIEATRLDIAGIPAVKALFATDGIMPVRTLPYQPTTDAPIHGRAIITETTLRKDGQTLIFLEPDDADNEVIRKALIERGKPAEGSVVLSAPHHGSRYSDLSIFKDLGWKPSMIVFQANAKNSFDHPHPESWLKAVELVGVKNVIITGAGGKEIVFDGSKPQLLKPTDVSTIVETILIPKITAYEREETRLSEELAASGRSEAAEKRRAAFLERGRALRELAGKYKISSRGKTPPWVLAAIDKLPTGTPKPPKGDGPPENGSFPANNGRPGPGGKPSSGGRPEDLRAAGGEAYKNLQNSDVTSAASGPLGATSGSRSGSAPAMRVERFNALTRGRPTFGGIVLGNSVEGPPGQVVKARFAEEKVTLFGEEQVVPILEVLIKSDAGQRWYRYDDWTPGELWSAYHFVKPKSEWDEMGTQPGGGGLVGKEQDCRLKDGTYGWCFGIHPAIANTPLAIDAMTLDWLIIGLESDKSQNDVVRGFLSEYDAKGIGTYQWISARGRVQAAAGTLSVISREQNDPRYFLKLRLVPESVLLADSQDAELSEENLPIRGFIENAYGQFAVVRRIDRLARSIALLNWLADIGALPSPPKVEPNWLVVQPMMSRDQARHHLGLASAVAETTSNADDSPDTESTPSDSQDSTSSDLDSGPDPGLDTELNTDWGNLDGSHDQDGDHAGRFVAGIGFTVLGFGLLSLKWYNLQVPK